MTRPLPRCASTGSPDRRGSAGLAAILGVLAVACSDPLGPEVFARPQPVDTNRVRIVIPEVYELANVIIAMTSYGQNSPTAVLRTGDYHRRVTTTFAPFRNHSSMDDLQLDGSDPVRRYYALRDNSFSYVFEDGEIRRNPSWPTLWNPNLFRERLSAVQRFAEVTEFRRFFAENAGHYQEVIERYRATADVDSMTHWLEREFPDVGYRYYTVVLSPLVYASHSAHFVPGTDEGIFFVSGPDVTSGPGTSAGVKKATVQRILFTEIDHAFVNPVTELHRSRVNTVFRTRDRWTSDNSSFYDSPVAVFNEYMTWGVFLLFIEDRLTTEDFEVVRQNTVQVMQSRRFQRFAAFSGELLRLYRNRHSGARVADLYPLILDWAATQ